MQLLESSWVYKCGNYLSLSSLTNLVHYRLSVNASLANRTVAVTKTKKRIYKFGKNTPLPAVNDGVISANYWSDILGWVVELKVKATWKGKPKDVYFMYCHLNTQSPLKVGTKVKSGDSVGGAGTTGSASSGVHLHFTLSTTSKGGALGAVYDAHAYISRRIKEQEAQIVETL